MKEKEKKQEYKEKPFVLERPPQVEMSRQEQQHNYFKYRNVGLKYYCINKNRGCL